MPKHILILGAHGMLGHTMLKYFSTQKGIEVFGTYRQSLPLFFKRLGLSSASLYQWDAFKNLPNIKKSILKLKPNVIINCIADLECRDENFKKAFLLNSYLPQYISQICHKMNILFIHISTDGVFSGQKGNYNTDDACDAFDNYGLTKISGEQIQCGVIIRASIIGRNIMKQHGILDWMINGKEKKVSGYTDYIFNGITTLELAKLIKKIIKKNKNLKNKKIYHIGSSAMTKYNLLRIINKVYNLHKNVTPKRAGKIDRSLSMNNFFSPKIDIERQLIEYKKFSNIIY